MARSFRLDWLAEGASEKKQSEEGIDASWRALFTALADGRVDALDELYDLAAGDIYRLALWRTVMTHRNSMLGDGLCPADPPPELRTRALTAARYAMERIEGRDIWMKILSSGSARFAWAVSVAVLLFGHIVMGNGVSAGSPGTALPLMAVGTADEELAEVADLDRLTTELPGWEVVRLRTLPPGESEDRS